MRWWIGVMVMAMGCGGGGPSGGEVVEVQGEDEPAHEQEEPAAESETPPEEPAAEAPAGRVFFVSPADGELVQSPVQVKFGVEGMDVEPAGEVATGRGHHHLLVNRASMPSGEVIPADATHIHYGGGQVNAELELEPGEYTLTMQFADGAHASYGEDWSASISVIVDAPEGPNEADPGKPPVE